ncbi:MAG: response regulator [Polyangiaceae bacterium]|nr:response regulator [Polyangiaceae bacterium]
MIARGRVLVVDDDENHLYMVRELLTLEGYEVKTYGSPFGATRAVNEFMPDVVLVDINMPGLSGDRLAPLLIKETIARVVLYSSNDEDSLRLAVEQTGAAGYVCKGDPGMLRFMLSVLVGTR